MNQRMKALKLANSTRKQRSDLKKQLSKDPKLFQNLMTDPPDYIYTMKIEALLLALPYFGRGKVQKVLKAARMSWQAEVGDLTSQRRAELAFVVRRYLK